MGRQRKRESEPAGARTPLVPADFAFAIIADKKRIFGKILIRFWQDF